MLDSLSGGFISIVAFVLMLGLLVLVHELGHFLTARWFGIQVDEFGIGYPPRALTLFERNGVKYTLNWLPIGGFVRFGGEGENIYSGGGSLANAAPWKKIIVLFAGPLMNLLLTMVIFIGLFLANGAPQIADGALISSVIDGTPAAAAQFKANDILIELDGRTIGQDASIVRDIAQNSQGRTLEAVVLRDGQRVTLQVTPAPWTDPSTGQQYPSFFGISYSQNATLKPVGLLTATGMGISYTWDVLGRFLDGLGQLIGGLFGLNAPPAGGVTGIVGIARGTGEVIQREGMTGFWQWTALISLNLFLVNLLPIPALDGSHILFSLIELVRRGKKIPPEREAMVHAIGFVVLMGLMVIVTFFDIQNWISGGSVLGG